MLDNTLSKVVYVADGIQKQWDIPFEFYKIEDVHIYITSDGENIEEIDQNYYYDEEGKFFIYPTEESELDPIPAGTQVLILRETENTQLEDSSEIYFKSKDIERGLDNLTMQVQDLKRDSLRAVKLSHFATQTPEDFTKGIFEAEKRAKEAAANASLSEQNAASSETSAVQASASATASAELAQSAANNSLQYAERAESAAAGSAASAVSSAESASLAQDLLNQVGESVYSKPEIDAKVSGLQAEIDLVESYIPLGTNDTNTLVNKQQLLDEEMDIREDLNEGLSELQTQITAQASAIANKQDKLVAGSNITIVGNVISSTGGGEGTGVEVEPATEETAGIISISTSEEAREGFDDTTAMTPLKTAQVIYDNVGRAIQLGFDGTLSGNVITFEPDTDTAYELKTGYNYIIDLLFPAVVADGTLDESISMVISNNGESIKIVNALNDDVDTDITVGNMKQIMKYTTDIGFRWIFNASLANTADGRKVFVMPSTVVNMQGGGSVPDNVYTQENLLGGKDIEIVPEPVEGGIDEHTLACWHFDDSPYDEVSGLGINGTATGSYTTGVFGNAIYSISGGKTTSSVLFENQQNITSGFTVDCFVVARSALSSSSTFYIFAGGGTNYYGLSSKLYLQTGEVTLEHRNSTLTTATVDAFSQGDKPHFALQLKDTFAEVFVEGKRVIRYDVSSIMGNFTGTGFKTNSGGQTVGMDELRISDIARYDGDFTPPTQPYRRAEPTGNYVINFTGKAGGSGKNIGEVYYSQSSLASDNSGALPLFTGETIASADTIYPDFYSWVESHTELQTTAEEYESALSTYGECPKYVVSNGTLRLPKLANYVKMANTTEGITQSEAGLPNITGSTSYDNGSTGMWLASNTNIYQGAFVKQGTGSGYLTGGSGTGEILGFDASLSSEVYGKSDTVTPSHTTLYPWVFAYNASVPASTAQAAEFQEGLSGKADADLGNIPTNYDYVVDSYSDEEGNWYRVYKSGWLEQGGRTVTSAVEQGETITLSKPFADTNYTVQLTAVNTRAMSCIYGTNKTTTSFQYTTIGDYGATGETYYGTYWEAKGQGA